MKIITGAFKGRSLKTISGQGCRPAMSKVRQALFSMLEARGVQWPQTRVLDMFAGSGSLGLEALSRGASFAAFIEADPKAGAQIRANAERFGILADRHAVWVGTAGCITAKPCATPFQVIFIDPPYGRDLLTPALRAVISKGWLAEGGILNAELESRLPFAPERMHPALACLADKTYGQTRVVVWQLSTNA